MWKMTIAVLLCLALLVACGPAVPLTSTSAQDMNLTADQVGPGYNQTEDKSLRDLEALREFSVDKITSSSYRLFQHESGVTVLSMVVVLPQPATGQDLRGLIGGVEEGFKQLETATSLVEAAAPAIGDEASLRVADLAGEKGATYFLGFRQGNVVGVVVVAGPLAEAAGRLAQELGTTLAGQID